MQRDRVLERLDEMVSSGRINPDEAAELRAAAGAAEFDGVMASIRARHAQAHTDAAVAAGTLSAEDAERSLARVRGGEHSADLRRHIRGAD